MPDIAYKARRSNGELIEGVMPGENESAVASELRRQGLFVVSVDASAARSQAGARAARAPRTQRAAGGLFGNRVNRKDLMLFTSQLSILLQTGSNLVTALVVLEEQTESPRMGEILRDVAEAVQGGEPLSNALERYPKVFDRVYVSMIRSGETSGTLTDTLKRLSEFLQNQARIRSNLRSAIMYPAILSVISIAVVVFMVTFVLPRFAGIFDRFDAKLPGPTQFLIDVSTAFRTYWYLVLGGVVAAIVGFRTFAASYVGKKALHKFVLSVSILGRLLRTVYTARIMRTMGVLLDSSIPILDAVQVARYVVPNVTYKPFFDSLRDNVTSGRGISTAFSSTRLMPRTVAQMVRTGEEAGAVAEVMLAVADHYDEEADRAIKDLTTVLEPAIIICMGGVVGFIAMSLVLPLFKLSSAIRG